MIPVKVSGMLMFLVLLQIMEYMVQSYHLELVFLVKATSRTFINRQPDIRLQDRIFRYRYIIPSDVGIQSA